MGPVTQITQPRLFDLKSSPAWSIARSPVGSLDNLSAAGSPLQHDEALFQQLHALGGRVDEMMDVNQSLEAKLTAPVEYSDVDERSNALYGLTRSPHRLGSPNRRFSS